MRIDFGRDRFDLFLHQKELRGIDQHNKLASTYSQCLKKLKRN